VTRHRVTRHRVALAAAVVSALALGACTTSSPAGGSTTRAPAGGSTTSSATSSSAATPSNTTVVRVSIRGKDVSPAPGNVNVALGTMLRLVVTSDHDDQLHAHGFDVEVTLKAGRPTTLDLRATTPGIYEIETHHPPLTLMHVVVR
jgi:hypothetical protein